MVIEDAAQALMAGYKGRALGSIGQLGGAQLPRDQEPDLRRGRRAARQRRRSWSRRAEIMREKGTDRNQFFRGEVDKYTWVDIGSSFLPSEIIAALPLAQLESAEAITRQSRRRVWERYHEALRGARATGRAATPGGAGRAASTTATCTTCCCPDGAARASSDRATWPRAASTRSSTMCRSIPRRPASYSAEPEMTFHSPRTSVTRSSGCRSGSG